MPNPHSGGGGGGMQILTPIAHLVFAPLNSCHLCTIPVGTSGKYQVGHIASRHQRVLFVCRSRVVTSRRAALMIFLAKSSLAAVLGSKPEAHNDAKCSRRTL